MPARLARALPRRARGRASSERDRRADLLGHKMVLYLAQSGRRMARWGRREAAGTRHRGFCEAGAGAGARVNIMALVSEK